jgi:hypothetical protein
MGIIIDPPLVIRKVFRVWLLMLALIGLCFWNSPCYAQINPIATEEMAELLAAQSQFSDQDWQDLQESLLDKSGIDINSIDEEEMRSWGLFTPWQLQQFFAYRKLLGNFIHVNEMQAIPGWHPVLIKMLLPHLKISQPVFSFRARKKFTLQPSLRTTGLPFFGSAPDSTSGSKWLGDRTRLFLQFRAEVAGIKMGITAKKDPGEPLWKKGIQRGFGYYGFHGFWQGKGLLKTVAIGDYTVNMGQGLIHWQTMSLRKSGELLWIKRQSPVIKPYRGGGEFNFHRGLATQLRLNKWELTGFISARKLTANISYDSSHVAQYFSSINTSGYHRSYKELASKNNLREQIGGIRIARQYQNFNWGINGVYYQYSLPWVRGSSPYQLFSIKGSHWKNASVDFSITLKNAHFFSELAIDKRGKNALLAGVILSVDAKLDLALVWRALSKEYQSLYANAFTENTIPSNETGLFLIVSLRPNPQLQVTVYNDFYQFPWLRYQVSMPSKGREHYFQATYQPSKNSVFILRLRQEQKQEDPSASSLTSPFPPLRAPIKTAARFHVEKKISREFQLRYRLEMLYLKNSFNTIEDGHRVESERGYLSYWETSHQFNRLGTKCSFRVQYFDTDSYKSRIYSYLSDPGSSFSMSASYGKGFLIGVFVSKKLKNNWLCNVSLLLKKSKETANSQLFPGIRLGWNL